MEQEQKKKFACPLSKADITAPSVFTTKFCTSTSGNNKKICFFQETAGKLIAVACLMMPEKMARELGAVLSGPKKKEEGYIR